MEAEKEQIFKFIDKIVLDGRIFFSKVNKLNEKTDPIKAYQILAKLEVVKGLVEELSQIELEDVKPDDATIPEIVPVSTSDLLSTTPMTSPYKSFVFDEFDELSELDALFDDLELAEFWEKTCSDNDNDNDSDNGSCQAFPCSINDICDYDSDTGICEY